MAKSLIDMYCGVLPEKLSDEEFKKYYYLYKNESDISARNKLIEHNLKLVYKIVYDTYNYRTIENNDFISLAIMALIKSIDEYDITRNKAFSTYAVTCILNALKSGYITYKKNEYISYDAIISSPNGKEKEKEKDMHYFIDYTFEDQIDKYIEKDYVDYLLEVLDDRAKDVMKMYYGLGEYTRRYSVAEISKKYNVSIKEIYRLINHRLEKIKNSAEDLKYRNKNILSKQRKMERLQCKEKNI